MNLFNSMQSILCILLMISVGCFFSHIGWFDEGAANLFSKVIVNIAVPCYLISSLMGVYDRSKLIHMAAKVGIPYFSILMCYFFGMIMSKILHLPSNRRGIFTSTMSISNTLFVGLPVNIALFGDRSIPFVFIYFIANVSLFWTIGAYGISRDGGVKGSFLSKDNLKKLFSPPLCALIITIALIFAKVGLPGVLMSSFKYMGNMVTPLSMLYIGITISHIELKGIRWDRSMSFIILGRFILSPVIVLLLCTKMQIPPLMKKVFIIQSAMPAMSITSVLAENSGGDHKYAALITTMTTVITLLFLPVYIILLNQI